MTAGPIMLSRRLAVAAAVPIEKDMDSFVNQSGERFKCDITTVFGCIIRMHLDLESGSAVVPFQTASYANYRRPGGCRPHKLCISNVIAEEKLIQPLPELSHLWAGSGLLCVFVHTSASFRPPWTDPFQQVLPRLQLSVIHVLPRSIKVSDDSLG
jgi:hypothetical protein